MIRFRKENGKITIGRQRVFNHLKGLPDGDFSLDTDEWKEKRRLRQNNLMWKWIEILADYHGYDKNSMYDVFIEQWAPIKTIEGLDGKPIQKKITTSKMTVEQMTRFMSNIDRHAAEFGVQLPRPEEELLQQPKRKTA